MSAVLERIGVKVLERPAFDNTHLGLNECAWIKDNTANLARWWTQLGGGTDEVKDGKNLNLWLRVQYQLEMFHAGKRS
jgi:hypothetical protein